MGILALPQNKNKKCWPWLNVDKMQEIKNKYGLMHKPTRRALGFSTSSNAGGDFCVETQHILELSSDKMWVVDNPKHAEWVRLNPTQWYNADYDTPTHDFDSDDLQVVRINVEIKVDVEPTEVAIPTPYEFFEKKYAEKEPDHWAYLKGCIEKAPEKMIYGLYDLRSEGYIDG